MSRCVQWAGRNIRLLGVEGYNSSRGGDYIFTQIQDMRPGRIFMESFAAGESTVQSGSVVPYRDFLPQRGLHLAIEGVAKPRVRETLTSEAVAVLAGLGVGATICVGDRLHVTSFDRVIEMRELDEVRLGLAIAVEKIAEKLESQPSHSQSISDVPQNFICPLFKELGTERQLVMAHLLRCAAEEGQDAVLVVGQEHLDAVEKHLHEPAFAPSAIESLLQTSSQSHKEGDAEWEIELEKRAAIAAFLATTNTFPPELVLSSDPDELLPSARAVVRRTYPKYRQAFMGRLGNHLRRARVDPETLQSLQTDRLLGVQQLEELCKSLEDSE